MPGWQRVYLAVCFGIIGYALAYALAMFADWPKLTYFPYAREWQFLAVPPGPVPSNYVGVVLWGVGGGAVAVGIALAVAKLSRRPLSDTVLRLVGAWTMTAFALAGLFFTWNLWPF